VLAGADGVVELLRKSEKEMLIIFGEIFELQLVLDFVIKNVLE